jgi:hypothetical protein
MGFDSELDLAVSSRGDEDPDGCIAGLRNRLLAEHLDADPEAVARAVEEADGSLIAVLDRFASKSGRTLRPIEESPLGTVRRHDLSVAGREERIRLALTELGFPARRGGPGRRRGGGRRSGKSRRAREGGNAGRGKGVP